MFNFCGIQKHATLLEVDCQGLRNVIACIGCKLKFSVIARFFKISCRFCVVPIKIPTGFSEELENPTKCEI